MQEPRRALPWGWVGLSSNEDVVYPDHLFQRLSDVMSNKVSRSKTITSTCLLPMICSVHMQLSIVDATLQSVRCRYPSLHYSMPVS